MQPSVSPGAVSEDPCEHAVRLIVPVQGEMAGCDSGNHVRNVPQRRRHEQGLLLIQSPGHVSRFHSAEQRPPAPAVVSESQLPDRCALPRIQVLPVVERSHDHVHPVDCVWPGIVFVRDDVQEAGQTLVAHEHAQPVLQPRTAHDAAVAHVLPGGVLHDDEGGVVQDFPGLDRAELAEGDVQVAPLRSCGFSHDRLSFPRRVNLCFSSVGLDQVLHRSVVVAVQRAGHSPGPVGLPVLRVQPYRLIKVAAPSHGLRAWRMRFPCLCGRRQAAGLSQWRR